MDDRRHSRRPAGFVVTIYDRRLGTIRGRARNVSAGGIFVETSGIAPPINTPVEIELTRATHASTRRERLECVVAHCADEGVGLMFALAS
ncbi:MAG: PilZ domain-containing protein [Gammaproteobacteria bacterium]|nr:PilZ domain-containing protein [Gammaproteobacteria bacterium]NIX85141.1 hypothetical protein [Gammaproteobacteria bacterium]